MRVVVGGAEHLSSGKIFPGGGNAAVENHFRRVHGIAHAEAGKRGTVGAQEKDGFLQVTLGLLDGDGGQILGIKRALGHDPGHGKTHLIL